MEKKWFRLITKPSDMPLHVKGSIKTEEKQFDDFKKAHDHWSPLVSKKGRRVILISEITEPGGLGKMMAAFKKKKK